MKWKKYLEANSIVDTMKESDLNTWINAWKERDSSILEDTLAGCQEAENVREMCLSNSKQLPRLSKKYNIYFCYPIILLIKRKRVY